MVNFDVDGLKIIEIFFTSHFGHDRPDARLLGFPIPQLAVEKK
jgi:hypothetical protein